VGEILPCRRDAQSEGGRQVSDTIILDSKKCNAELLTIHADGRITVAEHLKPTETAAAVLQIMREQWMADIQSKKIREQEDRIKRLEEAGNNLLWNFCPEYTSDFTESQSDALKQWNKAKEVKP
jgi:hypothetical protein